MASVRTDPLGEMDCRLRAAPSTVTQFLDHDHSITPLVVTETFLRLSTALFLVGFFVCLFVVVVGFFFVFCFFWGGTEVSKECSCAKPLGLSGTSADAHFEDQSQSKVNARGRA